MLGCSMHTLPFSAPHNAMLPMFVYATHRLSMYLCTLAYMFMHESCLLVCRPCFNTMKLWTSDPNLYLSLAETTFCLLSCLLHLYACLLYTHCALSMHLFLSIAYLLFSCLCLCMYMHGARTHGARAQSPRRKQKGQRYKHVNMSQVDMFSRFRGLASPVWLCTL